MSAARPATLLVALEAHLLRGADGRISAPSGIETYGFWTRYLEVFDRVLVAARTAEGGRTDDYPAVEGPGIDVVPLHDYPAAEGPGIDVVPLYDYAAVEGPGVEVVPLPDYRGPWEYLRARTRLALALASGIARADVLCLRAPGPIATLARRLRGGRPFGVEVVGDPLDALSRGAVRSLARPAARALLARALRRLCREAPAAAYVTEAALQRRYPPGGWATSYSSIDLRDDAFVVEADLARRHAAACVPRGTAARPWRLAFVGSLAQLYKGPDVLLDALALCRTGGLVTTLTMVGDGACRPALETYARTRGVGGAVCWAGQLRPGLAVHRVLDETDLFVLPSRQEGLPRALIEAMARGVPGVATRVGGIPELLPEDRLVPPGDPRALAATIGRALAAPERLVALARRDLAVARRYHAEMLRPRRRAFYERLYAAMEAA